MIFMKYEMLTKTFNGSALIASPNNFFLCSDVFLRSMENQIWLNLLFSRQTKKEEAMIGNCEEIRVRIRKSYTKLIK